MLKSLKKHGSITVNIPWKQVMPQHSGAPVTDVARSRAHAQCLMARYYVKKGDIHLTHIFCSNHFKNVSQLCFISMIKSNFLF